MDHREWPFEIFFSPPALISIIIVLWRLSELCVNTAQQRHRRDNLGAAMPSPDPCQSPRPNIKRSRSIYIVESPGGTLHETSPTKVYTPIKTTHVEVSASPKSQRDSEKPTVFKREPKKLSVRDTLLTGVAQGFARNSDHASLPRAPNPNPNPPAVFLTQAPPVSSNVAQMQKHIDIKSNLNVNLYQYAHNVDTTVAEPPDMIFDDTVPGPIGPRRRRVSDERRRVGEHQYFGAYNT